MADSVGQVVGVDGDDHRRRNPADVRDVSGSELAVAEVFEGVVGALPIRPGIDFSAGIDARFRERVQQSLELGAGCPGEPEVSDIGPSRVDRR